MPTSPARFTRTPVRYDIITTGTAARYREFAQLVANRGVTGRLFDIEVIASWGGHEGRARVLGSYTLDKLTETPYGGLNMLCMYLIKADHDALESLIREANDRAGAVDKLGGYDAALARYTAVRDTVAAAIGVDPSTQRVPTTYEEASEWTRWFVIEKLVDIVPT